MYIADFYSSTVVSCLIVWYCEVLLVTGGNDGLPLASTETLTLGQAAWLEVGQLPSARYGLAGVSVNNAVLMTGDA